MDKICTGPAHTQPTPLPITPAFWYYHKSGPQAGQPISRCKVCVNWHRMRDPEAMGDNHGWLLWVHVEPLFQELLLRCGGTQSEVARRTGLNRNTINRIVAGQRTRVQKMTAARIVAALQEARVRDRRNGSVSIALKLEAQRRDHAERRIGY